MKTVSKMRLSKETFNVLKNFSSINSNILIKPGNVIKTVSVGKNIFAKATVQEEFDTEIAIWDLNKFLGVISMFSNADLEFHDTHVDISNGRSTVTYFYSEPEILTTPNKDISMPKPLFSFDLDEQDLNEILKASSILQESLPKTARLRSPLKILAIRVPIVLVLLLMKTMMGRTILVHSR